MELDDFFAAEIAEADAALERATERAKAAVGVEKEALTILMSAQTAHVAVLRMVRAALKQPQYLPAIAAGMPEPCTG